MELLIVAVIVLLSAAALIRLFVKNLKGTCSNCYGCAKDNKFCGRKK